MNPVNLRITQLQPGSNFFRLGLPLPKGAVAQCDKLAVFDHADEVVDSYISPTAHWSDGSVKWCLVKVSLTNQNSTTTKLTLRPADHPRVTSLVTIDESESAIVIRSGPAVFSFNKDGKNVFPSAMVSDQKIWHAEDNYPALLTTDDSQSQFTIEQVKIDSQDALTATCVVSGSYQISDNKKLQAKFTFEFLPDSQVNLVCELHNPQRAVHPGGIWDLGDEGSVTFKDHSLVLSKEGQSKTRLKIEPESNWLSDSEPLSLFQASSGGDNWDSPVHINANGEVCNQFRGYKLSKSNQTVAEGNRAQPTFAIEKDNQSYTVNLKNFWQNFPKSIDIEESAVSLRLFPHHHGDSHELQGGERKTHEILFNFNPADVDNIQPGRPIAKLESDVYKDTGIFRYFDHELKHEAYDKLIDISLDPSKGFLAKRELQDEFGWRNFGEIYADHETAYHDSDEIFVSHYNNQYDSIASFAKQYALTGNPEWYQLMSELAEHVMDIDIYHTDLDRAEYNKGLFWHTDHYTEAKTSTHRTFSSLQLDENGNLPRGGGPGPQHCYSTGLMYYHYMTGSEEAKNTVLGLGEWMHFYYEGTGTLIETARKTLQEDSKVFINTCKGAKIFKYNYGLDRGTGNYIRTLLDCYELTTEPHYLAQAEHIIRSTAGPSDEIDLRELDNVEVNWYYVIFLQELIRYLDFKRDLDQFDNNFYYTRSTLLHYARWMVENEQPYLNSADKLEHANATWIAQETRKVDVLYAAYRYALKNRSPLLDKARFFRDYLISELTNADTLHYARIQALLLQNHGPSAFLDVASLPYPGFRDISIPDEKGCFHTPGSHLKHMAGSWVTSLCKFRIGKEIRWIKTRAS